MREKHYSLVWYILINVIMKLGKMDSKNSSLHTCIFVLHELLQGPRIFYFLHMEYFVVLFSGSLAESDKRSYWLMYGHTTMVNQGAVFDVLKFELCLEAWGNKTR